MLKTLYSAEQISRRVTELGEIITHNFEGKKLIVVTVLNGGMFFAADLVRSIQLPLKIDTIAVNSYKHHESSGKLTFRGTLKLNPAGADLLIVDDILDTGFTMCQLKEYFLEQGAGSVHVCCLIDKTLPPKCKLCSADFYAFRSPNAYLVGYGLDSDELYRNLPDVCILEDN